MPRVILFDLITGQAEDVEACLAEHGFAAPSRPGDFWRYPDATDSILYVTASSDIAQLRTRSAEEYELLLGYLGQPPTTHVFVEVSNRHPGVVEVKWLADTLLSRFGGRAFNDDLGYEHAWTLDEIANDVAVEGRPFIHRGR
jgi:hypothetical protein